MNWFTGLRTVEAMRAAGEANPAIGVGELWTAVRLGSGEMVESERYRPTLLPERPPAD